MKKSVIKLMSLVLALVLALSAVPFAAAACPDGCADNDADGKCDTCSDAMTTCDHSVDSYVTAENDGTHLLVSSGCDCGQVKAESIPENCADGNNDGDCDRCGAEMPEEPNCLHENTETTYVPNKDGTHMTVTSCTACTAEVRREEEVCSPLEGKCLLCGEKLPQQSSAVIICEGEHVETTSSTHTMTFSLDGVETADVEWTFSAEGSSEPTLSTYSGTGLTVPVVVSAGNDRGVARVKATAKWAEGAASGTFTMSFYTRTSVTVQVKDGIKSFTFMDKDVFSSISHSKVTAEKLKNYSIYSFMTDGCASNVTLYENRRANEEAGIITYNTTGKLGKYDPKSYNDYHIGKLDDLIFTVTGKGTYKLNFELYEMVGKTGFATTRGTVIIATGDVEEIPANIVYETDGADVTFRRDDFVDYWQEYIDEEYELDYVKFDPKDTKGLMYLDSTKRGIVAASYKFKNNYSKYNAGVYPLEGITYMPDPRTKSYTEEISFVAYGEGDKILQGKVTILVGQASNAPFADVKSSDWFYDEVLYVYNEGIMTGTSKTTFSPNMTLTRGMVVTMLYRIAGEPGAKKRGSFTDVAESSWYAEAVDWAAENGVVLGVGQGHFAPEMTINREQLVTVMWRYAKATGKDVSVGEDTNILSYDDAFDVSEFAIPAMQWACGDGVITGANGKLNPKGTATRAEAAAIFQRFVTK